MATSLEKTKQVQSLRASAKSLRYATVNWRAKYSDRQHYDKQGFGFTHHIDSGLNAFVVKVAFEAYTGTYGNSSVGRSWSVDQAIVDAYFTKALNLHKQTIFDTMAQFAEEDAAKLLSEARAEVAALNAMLDEVDGAPAVEAA